MVKNCRSGNEGGNVCMIEMRERDGKLFGVCMGCKDESVCLNQKVSHAKEIILEIMSTPKFRLKSNVC